MVRVSAEWFDDPLHPVGLSRAGRVGVFRGKIDFGGTMRFTLKHFMDQDTAELWALKVLLRFRSVFETTPSAPIGAPPPIASQLGEG